MGENARQGIRGDRAAAAEQLGREADALSAGGGDTERMHDREQVSMVPLMLYKCGAVMLSAACTHTGGSLPSGRLGG
jgi:hypothetical protein